MTTEMHKAPSVAHNTNTSGDNATSVVRYDLSTSEGGRSYVADFFARELRRHEFARYITTTLAADFACALAQHLAATGKQQVGEVQGDAWALARELRAAMYEADGRFGMADLIRKGHIKDAECGINVLAAALAARQPGAQVPVELACVAETMAHGEGLWMTCSGCHESNEGVQTGPYSQIMKCNLGNGCDECGGIGATWDTTDYQQMADAMSKSLAAPTAQGIDLGQLSAQHVAALRDMREHMAAGTLSLNDWRGFGTDALDAVLARIDQRDTAPGVGNG